MTIALHPLDTPLGPDSQFISTQRKQLRGPLKLVEFLASGGVGQLVISRETITGCLHHLTTSCEECRIRHVEFLLTGKPVQPLIVIALGHLATVVRWVALPDEEIYATARQEIHFQLVGMSPQQPATSSWTHMAIYRPWDDSP